MASIGKKSKKRVRSETGGQGNELPLIACGRLDVIMHLDEIGRLAAHG